MRSKYHHLQGVVKSNVMVGSRKALIGRVAWLWGLQKAIVVAVHVEEFGHVLCIAHNPATSLGLESSHGFVGCGLSNATDVNACILALGNFSPNNIASAEWMNRNTLGIAPGEAVGIHIGDLPFAVSHRLDR